MGSEMCIRDRYSAATGQAAPISWRRRLKNIKSRKTIRSNKKPLKRAKNIAFCAKKSTMPDIVLHLSTQAGVHNADGAVAAESMGFDRVILSREACIEDIREIARTTGIETEFFVQGALCVSFSGNCYFSSLASGFSGNRGKCMQLCRKKYVNTQKWQNGDFL